MLQNYSLPVDFRRLTQRGGRLEQVDLHESVRQNILLVLISRYGSLRADYSYGWGFWEHDFDHAKEINHRRLRFEQEVRQIILEREPRLDPSELKVRLQISRDALPSYRGRRMQMLKKTLHVNVEGRLLETNQAFRPAPFLVYFSPVAIHEHNSD